MSDEKLRNRRQFFDNLVRLAISYNLPIIHDDHAISQALVSRTEGRHDDGRTTFELVNFFNQ